MTLRTNRGDFASIEWCRHRRAYRCVTASERLNESAAWYDGDKNEALDDVLAILRRWEAKDWTPSSP